MPEINSQEPTLEKYNLDISVYKNYRERIARFKEGLAKLEEEKKGLGISSYFAYGISLFLSFLLLFYFGGDLRGDFWQTLIVSVFVAIYPSIFLGVFLDTDFIKNIFSSGRLSQIKKLSEGIKTQAEELERETSQKLYPFEKAAADYYQSQLREFFENNLYKKRSGSQQFEETLSEFSSMIEDLSTMNSVFITNSVSSWDLWGYKDYLKKRTINHNLRTSKKTESLNSVRNFVRNFSQPKEQEKKIVLAPEKLYRTARKIDNWEEINRKRKMTGLKGEEIAVVLEQEFFESIGRKDLAEKVRHVSAEDGDGLGYDVLSFFENGKEKYIEVKSTTASLGSSFYLSRNELGFLKEHNEDAFIYRVLISGEVPQVMTYSSPEVLEQNEIIPVQYMVKAK